MSVEDGVENVLKNVRIRLSLCVSEIFLEGSAKRSMVRRRSQSFFYFFFFLKKEKEYYRQLFWNPRFACKSYATTVKLLRANYNRYFPTLDALHESDRDLDYFWTTLRPRVDIVIRHVASRLVTDRTREIA